jgi:hypothetical protein
MIPCRGLFENRLFAHWWQYVKIKSAIISILMAELIRSVNKTFIAIKILPIYDISHNNIGI